MVRAIVSFSVRPPLVVFSVSSTADTNMTGLRAAAILVDRDNRERVKPVEW